MSQMNLLEMNLELPSANKVEAAEKQYLEQYGRALVTNTYLRIALLCLSLIALGLLVLNFRTYAVFRNFKPLVIRINDVGRAEAVAYESMLYQPRDAEIRYFLIQFVTQYYARVRATVRENFSRSLFFLDGRLADATIEANKKNKTIETFLATRGEEIEISVSNVTIEDMRTPPYKATVDFEKTYYEPADHVETRHEKYVASFVFIVRDRVPNTLIPVNPLGLTITYFREDQAFQ
ncbi:MAG TPA: VirB8/TrbF family protein [Bryobacteraceae bacterium]|nr:VirB8/TrbF family protein [Bryobacteraceae bacterium]